MSKSGTDVNTIDQLTGVGISGVNGKRGGGDGRLAMLSL